MNTYTLFAVLITIVSLLLILVIMVQNPKGGGLSSSFGGGNMIGGVQKTNDFLDKATWTLAFALVFLTIISNVAIPRANTNIQDASELNIEAPVLPQAPATELPAADADTAK